MKSKITKIYLVSADNVGENMAGPGVRYFEMAKVLAKHFTVILLVPDNCEIKGDGFEILCYNSRSASRCLGRYLGDADVVIAQSLRPPLLRKIRCLGIKYIADLYDPLTIEVLEYAKDENPSQKKHIFDFNYYSLLLQIESATHLLCSSKRQRDFYSGVLSDQRVIDSTLYDIDPNLSQLLSITPFGLSKNKLPKPDLDIVKNKIPTLKPDDKLILWGGGIWNWFDAISVVRAIEKISRTRSDIKLFFLGVKHPNPKIKQMRMAQKTIDYCKERDLINKSIFFNFGWTPFKERVHFLARANIGISTHFDNLETRLSFRTRVLDYLWAELPMVLTEGDSFADLCLEKNLGEVVKYENVDDIAKAIIDLADNTDKIRDIKANIKETKKNFYWDNCLNDVVNLISNDNFLSRPRHPIKFLALSIRFYLAGFKKKITK